MKKIVGFLIVLLLIFSLGACQNAPKAVADDDSTPPDASQEEADTPAPPDEESSSDETEIADVPTPTEPEPQFPDTWYDFSGETPILDDAGDADINDITNVFAAHDDYYIYVAFEVGTDHIDSTTMISSGTCIFVGIDDPDYFSVGDPDKNTYADIDGNGDYCGQATYKYADGLLQIRVPLSIYGTPTEFTINTLLRANIEGDKIDADTVEDFVYLIEG